MSTTQIDNNQLLRFTTAGSVDDGKSTLIGRLLYDSKAIFEDQLAAVETTSKRKGHQGVDLALFTDGLKDEREQGITIDVAYRYFTTPKRKFIIADTPGHIQYTRNMVTGASTANAALILIDARNGVIEQTKRHAFIASLLQIPHLIVCINKMDLVDYSEEIYEDIIHQFEEFSSKLYVKDVRFLPISALDGDNVVNRSENMKWFQGAPLLHTLENLHISSDINKIDARFPVQTVLRPQRDGYIDYRGYAGRVASGIFRPGDDITVMPSGFTSKIRSIDTMDAQLEEAYAPMSVAITLEDDIDISRGDMIVKTNNKPEPTQEFDAMLCWLHKDTARPRAKYSIVHTSNEQKAMIKDILYKIDINTYNRDEENKDLSMNDIARIKVRTTRPLMIDEYRDNRITGSFILIDDSTHETVAAGMIL
ncbi:MAG: GTP-binding protein [Flavobacteriales bacterium]|jgi:sulfate adenylyltransferase subunit 1|uniref:sulfate adenylyltransferase subunit 1 n=1 Tax=Candidatus Ulvibacter alkanivorans TaxID=2267620 RepID=UPI000DF3B727|nr:GTP-binding protein [Candidatus Ulvibacter alkanivorans]MCH2490731.1 GTP-binding protein [Flavobacteriales bacterium]